MNKCVKVAVGSVLAAAAVTSGVTACSSSPAQSSLGPFTMSSCKLGWGDGDASTFFASKSAANTAATNLTNAGAAQVKQEQQEGMPNSGTWAQYSASPASEFSITLTATAVVQSFTVAYYNSSGSEISTGTANLVSGPSELTAGQTATFMDDNAPSGAASCQVIGSDSGNA